ncbi:cell division protein SepF [Canibacter zhoujuaniae]|uniref:cell division protein SepF n=1 Tax=Canibacter zhoujuaniae TaxID=2708343 RepID=UPI0014239400|nr:cell division protein SepF [Canibacter zhoujuaniae]
MANPMKKAMVYLGLAEEELAPSENETEVVEAPAGRGQKHLTEQPVGAGNVTPLHAVTPTYSAQAQPLSEILTVHPTHYAEAPVIAENFREGVPVIINLSRMSDVDSKRLIDFASGLVMGLNGHFERVTGKVFLLTPAHIAVGEPADEENANDSGSFFIAPAAQ